MIKRISAILTIVSIVTMMLLSSCTDAGVDLYLTGGAWQCEKDGLTKIVELTDKDGIKVKTKVGKTTTTLVDGKVKSVENNKINFVYSPTAITEVEAVLEYKDLTCETVKFKIDDGDWDTYRVAY